LEGLLVSDLVAAELTYATSGIESFELAIFGNSRSIMLGIRDISHWKDGHFFNFTVGGLHHFYLGKTARGMVNLAVFAVGVFLIFILPPIGIAIINVIFMVELWALVRS
jgi:hypothetical protein